MAAITNNNLMILSQKCLFTHIDYTYTHVNFVYKFNIPPPVNIKHLLNSVHPFTTRLTTDPSSELQAAIHNTSTNFLSLIKI